MTKFGRVAHLASAICAIALTYTWLRVYLYMDQPLDSGILQQMFWARNRSLDALSPPLVAHADSRYWISHKAIKTVYDAEHRFASPPHDITLVKNTIYEYFNLTVRYDILNDLYEKFQKSNVAGLCKPLAKMARTTRDPLAVHIFHLAGAALGQHVRAVIPKADESLLTQPGGLHIVAVGSVLLHCWDLLKDGFLEALDGTCVELTVVVLQVSSAVGAASLGARAAGHTLPINFADNTRLLFHHMPPHA